MSYTDFLIVAYCCLSALLQMLENCDIQLIQAMQNCTVLQKIVYVFITPTNNFSYDVRYI